MERNCALHAGIPQVLRLLAPSEVLQEPLRVHTVVLSLTSGNVELPRVLEKYNVTSFAGHSVFDRSMEVW